MSSAFEGLPKTPNLSLNKPGYDNVADIEALNENADILDEEISTIKSNLKNKGSATEPIYFDGNGVPQKTKNFNDYLPLAGGLMTDMVIGRSVNNSQLVFRGGTNADGGAALMVCGKDYNNGRFLVRANNGSAKNDLIGTADGTLMWNSKNIVRSVNGTGADSNGNVVLDTMPTGTVIPFAGNSIPTGYLLCNGSAISRTTYADLFAVIGTTYGSGDGSTTFNLPNLTDKFIQGSDTAGTVKSAGLPNVTGYTSLYGHKTEVGSDGALSITTNSSISYTFTSTTTSDKAYNFKKVYLDLKKSNSIYGNSTTVQPPALTMRYIIKY